jgi:cytosine/adenosine deaminase-related metal-dependent hydrolase
MRTISLDLFRDGEYALQPDLILGRDGELFDVVLVVKNGTIADVCSPGQAADNYPHVAVQRLEDCAIIPSFVDCHHHILDPFAKSVTFGEPAQIWRRVWMPLEATSGLEDCYIGAKWSFLEAMRGGVTCVVNHAMRDPEMIDAANRAADETGIRLVSSVGAYDLRQIDSAAGDKLAKGTIDDALRMADRHLDLCTKYDRVYPSIACGNLHNNTPEMVTAVARYCRERGLLFQIHANEHTPEVHFTIENYGKRPIELLHSIDALGSGTLIAHATLVTPSEVVLLRETDSAVSYNPVASMWKGNAIAPALTYIRQNIRVGLGSDVTRNDGFRMLEAAETCQRLTDAMAVDDFSCGAGWVWVDAATRVGASAAGLGDVIGSLEKGKQADFLILDLSAPEVLPSWDFTWELVRFFDRSNLLCVVVAGEPTILHGKAVKFDSEAFVSTYKAYAQARIPNAGVVRIHGPSRRHRPGAPSRTGSLSHDGPE